MCNEFRFEDALSEILDAFSQLRIPIDWEGGAPNLEPRASIRPTDRAFVLAGRDDGGVGLLDLPWGFPGPRGPVINFRSEGRRLPSGRCLVPMTGFYEFTGDKAPKSKWLFEPAEGGFLCAAGLIRESRFTILTCAPGPDVGAYHDRQVALLPRSHWSDWLDHRRPQPPLGPAPAGTLKVTQVR
ncbi:MAG: SOS response-associated peptidase family protein [Phenylobacterium sp.]|nr:SOS response-associated peptidase family protein [Phenylobacterium sp.]